LLLKALLPAIVILAPASLTAQPNAPTHEIVTMHGKSTVQVRPLARQHTATANCHPDASKAVACEAQARQQRAKLFSQK
jgi:hypothetical protein